MNTACNAISEVAWIKKIFSQFTIHKAVYHPCKATFNLSSYKPEKMKKRSFRKLGGIAHDSRRLAYKENSVSDWSVGGRLKMPVYPAYTSKTCCVCHHIGKRDNKFFKCENCGRREEAGINASKNMAALGAAINQPEKPDIYSCSVQYLGLKPNLSALAVGG